MPNPSRQSSANGHTDFPTRCLEKVCQGFTSRGLTLVGLFDTQLSVLDLKVLYKRGEKLLLRFTLSKGSSTNIWTKITPGSRYTYKFTAVTEENTICPSRSAPSCQRCSTSTRSIFPRLPRSPGTNSVIESSASQSARHLH